MSLGLFVGGLQIYIYKEDKQTQILLNAGKNMFKLDMLVGPHNNLIFSNNETFFVNILLWSMFFYIFIQVMVQAF